MTSTTLTLQEFSDKLQQATVDSRTPEHKFIGYWHEPLFILAEDDIVAYLDVPGAIKIAAAPPCYKPFNSPDDQNLQTMQKAYEDTLSEGTHKYREIELTFRNESGDHAGKAIVPIGFKYDLSESLIIDGTGYQCKSDHNILE